MKSESFQGLGMTALSGSNRRKKLKPNGPLQRTPLRGVIERERYTDFIFFSWRIIMRFLQYLSLSFFLMASYASAETIDAEQVGSSYFSESTGSTAQVCKLASFITRNSGRLITGLVATNLKLLEATSLNLNSLFPVSWDLVPTSRPGVYKLCLTPKYPNTWSSGDSGYNSYEFSFLVNGTEAADHGILWFGLWLSINNSNINNLGLTYGNQIPMRRNR